MIPRMDEVIELAAPKKHKTWILMVFLLGGAGVAGAILVTSKMDAQPTPKYSAVCVEGMLYIQDNYYGRVPLVPAMDKEGKQKECK